MLETIRFIVFDFDGTLATCPYDFQQMRHAVLTVALAYGLAHEQMGGHAGLLETIELGVGQLAAEPERAHNFRAEALANLAALEYEAAAHTVLLPGIRQALSALHTAGFRAGIITRNSSAAVGRIIGAIPLPISHLLCREAVPRPKPHPDHAQRMLRLLGGGSSQALMVGDHPMDIEAGRAAGMHTAAVTTGQSDEATLRAAQPDLLFSNVVDLVHALLEKSSLVVS